VFLLRTMHMDAVLQLKPGSGFECQVATVTRLVTHQPHEGSQRFNYLAHQTLATLVNSRRSRRRFEGRCKSSCTCKGSVQHGRGA
jgi:hypothetical protein